ncbi:glycosyltransferase family 2 protein [Chitinophaga rhizophila]|uniref:Glycosyltransferase n=1 Tax=Chitinophaga rhizophila TaxID=2866212 RepID=A0ABS7GKL8_9BACT|nr:glycosyltransferase family 2 protein [Chitinophaga rhizophila]MBW8688268.1 glycosyltransferase [Chitinophaga rhizophila]
MVPVITIISVVYNGADTLEDTIRSVLSQSYPNIRFMIIDGGSKDGTLDIITKYAEDLHYYCSEPDQGIYDAMNKGWGKAASDSYILYLGAGDRILQLPSPADLQKADVIYGTTLVGSIKFKAKADDSLKIMNTLHHQSLLVKKQLHPDPPFRIQYRTYADFDFNQRLYKAGASFYHVPDFVAYALPGGVSSTIKLKEILQIVKANFGRRYMLLAFPVLLLIITVTSIFYGSRRLYRYMPGMKKAEVSNTPAGS